MLTWPHDDTDWRKPFAELEQTYLKIVHEITKRELALIVCNNEPHYNAIGQLFVTNQIDLHQIRFSIASSNDSWSRDHGPITIIDDQDPVLLDFVFNGWGQRYPADLDNLLSRQTHNQRIFNDVRMESIHLVLEGGSVEVDGHGTLMTTSQCLLSENRNPGLDRYAITQLLQKYLGIKKVLWLDHGMILGDDTDSHIDMLARFCNSRVIAYASCEDRDDAYYHSLREMKFQLKSFTNLTGQAYQLVPLPLPSPKFDAEGRRLPASYLNFLIINDAVLVPIYEDPFDQLILDRFEQLFPSRDVIGIDCTPLIQQYGSLHCITMQIPPGVIV